MAAMFQVRPIRIIPQRDEFKVKGKKEPVVDYEFFTSTAQGEDVIAFKRFVAECELDWGSKPHPISIIFNVRSNFIRVLSNNGPLNSEMIAQGLVLDLGRFKIKPPVPMIETSGVDRPRDLYPVVHRSEAMFEFATDDALWFCAALHDARDRKSGFSGNGVLDPRRSPFSG